MQLDVFGWFIDDIDTDYSLSDFARNDGLNIEDFKSWFKGQDFSIPKAIIHFSNFRYCSIELQNPERSVARDDDSSNAADKQK